MVREGRFVASLPLLVLLALMAYITFGIDTGSASIEELVAPLSMIAFGLALALAGGIGLLVANRSGVVYTPRGVYRRGVEQDAEMRNVPERGLGRRWSSDEGFRFGVGIYWIIFSLGIAIVFTVLRWFLFAEC